MASIYQRRLTWRVQFYHPLTGKLTRESVDTHDPARAELLRRERKRGTRKGSQLPAGTAPI